MADDILFSQAFQTAAAQLQTRAERLPDDPITLIDSFVDFGILEQIQNNKNQIVYGRRGTGKTHLLRALSTPIARAKGLHCYIDCRTLGSGPIQATDDDYTLALRWYKSIIRRILDFALDEVLRMESLSEAEKDSATDPLNPIYEYLNEPRTSDVGAAFGRFVDRMGVQFLTIVLDEWVQIPIKAQPFVAELLKRTFFAQPKINIKIGAIRLYSRFYAPRESGRIGFEIGADIFADLDMDLVLIYDKDKAAIERFYANLLCRHLRMAQGLEIEDDSLSWLSRNCFSSEKVFSELVRAAEGVPRDFLHLFHQAFVIAFRNRAKQNRINTANVQKAAERWYIDDKLDAIWENPNLSKLLQGIVDEVLQGKRARMFIIEQELARHPLILSLTEARLLHVVRRGWSHAEKRGVRYDILSIDFGAYASRMNTQSAPQIELFPLGVTNDDPALLDESELLIPFDDDMRAIRRVEVTRGFLSKFEFMQQDLIAPQKDSSNGSQRD